MSDSSESAKSATSATNVNTRQRKKRVSTDQRQESSDFRRHRLKVPTFPPDDPEIWFALLEDQFEYYGITDDVIKFRNVTINLDITHAKAVKDIITKPPKTDRYKKIKSELIKRLSASHEKKVRQLLTDEVLGDRKPTQFLRHLQDLAGPDVPEEFLRSIWSSRLPKSIQTVLTSRSSDTLEELADLADRIQEISTPKDVAMTSANVAESTSSNQSGEIYELRKMVERLAVKLDEHTRSSLNQNRSRSQRRYQRSPPRGRSRSRSAANYERYPTCWYHARYGSRARKCQKPCDFKAGNEAGSR